MALHSPLVISSPPRPPVIFCSSSPDIPPLDTLLRRRSPKPLRSGSGAASIPSGATTGFQSARLLQRDDVEDDIQISTVPGAEKPNKRRKMVHNKDDALEGQPVAQTREGLHRRRHSPKLGRYVFDVSEAIEETADAAVVEDCERQGCKDGQVDAAMVRRPTKTRLGVGENGRRLLAHDDHPVNDAGAPSMISHKAQDQSVPPPDPDPDPSSFADSPPKGHDEKTQTPTTSRNMGDGSGSSKELAARISAVVREPVSNESPSIDFQAAWSYSGPEREPNQPEAVGDLKAASRKSSTTDKPKAPQQKKPKQAPKSLRTVTSVAIAQYQDAPAQEDCPSSQSFWDQSESARAAKLLEPTSKSQGKTKAKKPPKKLPDPEVAQSRVTQKNEFFFGTSSQLTRNEPDDLVRDLQRAMKESEDGETITASTSAGLWTSGARGHDDSLLEAEEKVTKIKVYSPKRDSYTGVGGVEHLPRLMSATSTGKGVLHSLSLNLLTPTHRSPSNNSPSKHHARSYVTDANEAAEAKPVRKGKPRGRPRKNPPESSAKNTAAKHPQIAAKKDSANVDPDTDAGLPQKPKRRRSKKTPKAVEEKEEQTATLQEDILDIDEVEEREQVTDATNKKRSKAKPSLKQAREDFLANKAATVFPAITKVIKTQSRDRAKPKELTWHEKILLYDPIVLEDVTAWLKSSPLKDEDEDKLLPMEELKPWMVQLWCEEHSICNIWKEGLRGGVKLKY
ncbi:MAG: hypothetical protein Q9162_001856 [Coniocarpon cinnabarinum]